MSDIIPSPSPTPYHYIHPAHRPLTEIKEPTISKIELSEKDTAKLKHVTESRKMGDWSKEIQIRRLVGLCFTCSSVPEWILTKYYDGVQLNERYCDKCLQSEKDKANIK